MLRIGPQANIRLREIIVVPFVEHVAEMPILFVSKRFHERYVGMGVCHTIQTMPPPLAGRRINERGFPFSLPGHSRLYIQLPPLGLFSLSRLARVSSVDRAGASPASSWNRRIADRLILARLHRHTLPRAFLARGIQPCRDRSVNPKFAKSSNAQAIIALPVPRRAQIDLHRNLAQRLLRRTIPLAIPPAGRPPDDATAREARAG